MPRNRKAPADAAYGVDYATDTVVIKNRIYKFDPSTMIWTHGSPADIRLNETVPAGTIQPKRTSQCYDINSETVYEHNATRDVSGFAYTCNDGIWVSPVLGYLNPLRDLRGHYQLGGWACLKASPSSIDVHLYVEGPYDVGTFFRTVSANRTTTPAIDTQCGTTGVPHTFSYRLTSTEFNSNKGKIIFVHGISGFPDIVNEVLNGSGRTIPLTPPHPDTTRPTVSIISPTTGSTVSATIPITATSRDNLYPRPARLTRSFSAYYPISISVLGRNRLF